MKLVAESEKVEAGVESRFRVSYNGCPPRDMGTLLFQDEREWARFVAALQIGSGYIHNEGLTVEVIDGEKILGRKKRDPDSGATGGKA